MTTDTPSEQPFALGFLTVVDQSSQGLVGGYLLLNAHARPLEFHCTVPVRPNRAQEILYGATLEPFIYGEQIGPTLIKTSKLRPAAVFTDCCPALAAAAHVEPPLWLVLPPEPSAPNETDATEANQSEARFARRPDSAQNLPAGASRVRLGRNWVVGTKGSDSADAAVSSDSDKIAQVAATLDLSEPFERIRAAIQESQRGGR